jgi:hypothetical protein
MKLWKLWRVCLAITFCIGLLGLVTSCTFFEHDDNDGNTPKDPTIPMEGEERPTNLVIDDPLTNGKSNYAAAYGGEFTLEGYKVNSAQGQYLAYSTDIIGDIRVEFDAKGFNYGGGKDIIIEIFDSPHDAAWVGGNEFVWRTYSFFQIVFAGFNGKIRIKAGRGVDDDGGTRAEYVGPFDWDPDRNYHWVFLLKDGYCEITRNGEMLVSGSTASFQPFAPLNMRIGGTWHPVHTGVAGVTYSNVRVYRE